MIITHFSADGFKNLKEVDLTPSPQTNIIKGENAQGKTNLCEAIWVLSGSKSFRGTKEKDLVGFDREYARLGLTLKDSEREQKIEAVLSKNPKERKITLNGVKQRYLSGLFGVLKCVIFTPEDLELTKGSPDVRRDFLDLCVSQIKPRYRKTAQNYADILAQRNATLKNIQLGRSKESDLEIWDGQLARLGAYISLIRTQYSKKLWQFASRLYDEISGGKERLELGYVSTVFDKISTRDDWQVDLCRRYLERLTEARGDDIRAGFSTVGVHRDDLSVMISGISAREFGSQGQNRSAVLAMKLAEAYILKEETGEMPVILLDDVLSELDRSRREFIISKLEDMQVFLTCCDRVPKIAGKRVTVRDGRVK